MTNNDCFVQHSSPYTICPQSAFVKVASFKVFFPEPWLLVCQLSTFATISVNLILASSLPAFKFAATRKTSLSEFCVNTQALRGSPNLFWLFRGLYFLNLLKSILYKFQTKLWITELLLSIDASPYIVFILIIDAQSQLYYLFTHSTNI